MYELHPSSEVAVQFVMMTRVWNNEPATKVLSPMDSCIQVEFEAEADDTYSNIAPLEVDRSHLDSSGVVLAKRDQNEDDEPSTSVIVVETHHQLLCTDHVCQKHY